MRSPVSPLLFTLTEESDFSAVRVLLSPRLGRRDGTQKDEVRNTETENPQCSSQNRSQRCGLASYRCRRRPACTSSSKLTRRLSTQPFAWPAREFLRKACVGKAVTFELEETVASIGKSFGHVYLDGENLSTLIVQAGWAKVKPPMGNNPTRTAYQEELQRMEAQAQSAGIGMWSKDAGSMTTIRNVIMPGDAGYDAKDVLDNFKGQAQVDLPSPKRTPLISRFTSVFHACCQLLILRFLLLLLATDAQLFAPALADADHGAVP